MSEQNVFARAIQEAANKKLRFVMKHRDRYLKAWIAATGLDPRECKMVERHFTMPDGSMKIKLWFERNVP